MAVPSVRPTRQQLDDLAAMCKLGSDQLAQIRQRLDSRPTISRRKIEETVTSVVPELAASAVTRFLLSAGITMRRRSAEPGEFIEGIARHLRALPKEDTRFPNWEARRSEIELLLRRSLRGLGGQGIRYIL